MKKQYRTIMGKNAIRELVRSAPERIVEVYTSQLDEPLVNELKEQRIPVKKCTKQELSQWVESDSHQGFVAALKERSQPTLDGFLEKGAEKSLVLMLDSIYDPQNFGSILRASECFGVDAVIYSKNRGASVTPTVAKVSSGASELVPLIRVSNLAESIKPLQEAGYWVVCTDIGEQTESLYDFKFPEKTVIVMGSEGEGVRALLKKRSDHRIYIPMMGQIDSLNVSQATAVLLATYRSQIGLGD